MWGQCRGLGVMCIIRISGQFNSLQIWFFPFPAFLLPLSEPTSNLSLADTCLAHAMTQIMSLTEAH